MDLNHPPTDFYNLPYDLLPPKKRKPYIKRKSWRKPHAFSSKPRKWSFKGILSHSVCSSGASNSTTTAASSTTPPVPLKPLPDLNATPPDSPLRSPSQLRPAFIRSASLQDCSAVGDYVPDPLCPFERSPDGLVTGPTQSQTPI